jgi:multimeric flavodoxin WrbA
VIAMPFGNSVATAVAVAIVFHSGYGHTARHAEAVRRGIDKVPGASVLFLTLEEAPTRWEAVKRADAIIFGAVTYT